MTKALIVTEHNMEQPPVPQKTLLRHSAKKDSMLSSQCQGRQVEKITEYELVTVGSGIQIGRWTKEPEKFLKKFQKELRKKKVALFVCCGSAHPLPEKDRKPEDIDEARRKYLEEKAAKYNLQPLARGFLGGVYNFNKVARASGQKN